jgi:hypothetical protein
MGNILDINVFTVFEVLNHRRYFLLINIVDDKNFSSSSLSCRNIPCCLKCLTTLSQKFSTMQPRQNIQLTEMALASLAQVTSPYAVGAVKVVVQLREIEGSVIAGFL